MTPNEHADFLAKNANCTSEEIIKQRLDSAMELRRLANDNRSLKELVDELLCSYYGHEKD